MVVNVERSLGLAILHNGELFRGANGLSPDLGDFRLRTPSDGGWRLAEIVVREWSDGVWLQGAAAMTLRDLYGASWSTTGPAPIRVSAAQAGDMA